MNFIICVFHKNQLNLLLKLLKLPSSGAEDEDERLLQRDEIYGCRSAWTRKDTQLLSEKVKKFESCHGPKYRCVEVWKPQSSIGFHRSPDQKINAKRFHLTQGKHQLLTPSVAYFLLASYFFCTTLHYPTLPCSLRAVTGHTPQS